ncbi:N,N-dimethylformamidase beta subunit family domain-containing protein [Nocardioides sp. NPDC092400]|uniref:N,N-dimethylformamidase beta subunit family domain-containing protein n=1 Tax=Nocardioides sp. NPDC092400 TaxID=3155196 RepID=UPI003432A5E4
MTMNPDTLSALTNTPAPAFAWSPKGWPSERPSSDPADPETWIYTDRYSYSPGETVTFHISSSAEEFELEIVRDGSRPTTVHHAHHLTAPHQETPEDAYAAGCGWTPTHSWQVPEDCRSGFFLVTVRNTTPHGTWEREHFFVVRAAADRRSDIALVLTTGTLSAYNDWGGANHYRGIGDDPRNDSGSPLSSTQRPIGRGMLRKPVDAPREYHPYTPSIGWVPRYDSYEWARFNGYSRHHADAFWATYERSFVVWAEEAGYELDYLTQVDLHQDPTALDGYSCAVVVGHDEYWTWEQRDVVDAFVERGGGFARFAGNFQWQVRLSEDGTTQYCYRLPSLDPEAATTPRRATTNWEAKSVGRPGATTIGLNGLGGIYNRYGAAVPRSSGGFTVYRPEHWSFEGTDLYYGDLLGGAPAFLAAFEVDSVEYTFRRGLPYPTYEDGAPETLEILAMCPAAKGEEDRFGGQHPIGGPEAEVYAYNAELGDDLPYYVHENQMRGAGMIAAFTRGDGEVFNGGSTEWSNALRVGDPFVDRIVRNVLDRFTKGETR